MKHPSPLLAPLLSPPGSLLLAMLAASVSPLHAQTVRTWNGATGGAWHTVSNWNPNTTFAGAATGIVTGEGLATDIMAMTAANSASNIGINMNTMGATGGGVGLILGAIDFNKTNTTALQIGNSSTTVNGILQLNGATVNSVAKTLIRVSGSANLTIANVNSGTGTQTMGLQLGITDGIFDVDTGRTLTISSAISEAAATSGFTKTGAGTLSLSGANTFTGPVSASAGTLNIANYSAFGGSTPGTDAPSGITVSGGASLNLQQVGAGTTVATYSPNLTLSGNLRTTGGSGTNTLSVTWSGKVTLTGNSLINPNGNGAVRITGQIDLGSNTLTYQTDGSISSNIITGGIIGSGSLIKTSGNTLFLNSATSYTGTTTISGGVLSLGNVNALANTTGITIAGGSTLSTSVDGITLAAPITLGTTGTNSTILFSRNTSAVGNLNLNGLISGDGNLVFSTPNVGSGGNVQTMVLGSANTYAGTTTITTGNVNNSVTIKAGAANALPATTVLTLNGGTGTGTGRTVAYDLNGFSQTLAGLTNTTGLSLRNQRVINSSATAATLTLNNTADFTYSGELGNGAASNFGLTKTGSAKFTLSATNSFSGPTTVNAGILSLSSSLGLRNSPLDTLNSVAGDASNGLQTTVTALTLGGLSGNKNLASVFTTASGGYDTVTALTLNPGTGSLSYSGAIADGAAGMTLTKTGAGTQILSGVSTYTGGTTVSAGTLTAGNAGAFGSGNITVNTGGTLDVASLTVPNTITLNGGSLVGASSIPGPTSVSGSSTLNSNGVTFTGAVTVGAGGSVSGTGVLSGGLVINTGGTLSPGNSPGTLNAGNTVWNGGGSYRWELNSVVVAPGASQDFLNITGTLTINATSGDKFNVNVISLTGANVAGLVPDFASVHPGYAWTIVSASGGIANFTAGAFNLDLTGFQNVSVPADWQVQNIGNNILLVYVPEPSSYAALAGLAALGLAWKRRRPQSTAP